MIDYLIRCSSVEEADNLLEYYGPSSSFPCQVILSEAEWNYDDPENPVLITEQLLADGFHIWVSVDSINEDLINLPDNNCRLAADRALCTPESTFMDVLIHIAGDIEPNTLSTAYISPVPAGSDYPWRR